MQLRRVGISELIPKTIIKVDRNGYYSFNLVKQQTYDLSIIKNGFCFQKEKVRVVPTKWESSKNDFVMTGKEIYYNSTHSSKAILEYEDGKLMFKDLK